MNRQLDKKQIPLFSLWINICVIIKHDMTFLASFATLITEEIAWNFLIT